MHITRGQEVISERVLKNRKRKTKLMSQIYKYILKVFNSIRKYISN